MKLNTPGNGHQFTRAALARFFRKSIRTIDRWGIARAELLTAKEAAQRLNVSRRSFDYLIEGQPEFPKPIRFGKSDPLWRADELDAWKARQNAPSKPEQLLFL